MLRAMGGMMTAWRQARDRGVRHRAFVVAKQLVEEGVLTPVRWCSSAWACPGARRTICNTFIAMVNNVPATWIWSAFSLGRNQMAYVAAAVLAGGNVRVGLEDNLWLDKGVLATNAQLVERAVNIVENLGARIIGPDEVRKKLKLTKRRRSEPIQEDSAMKTVKFTAMKDGDTGGLRIPDRA